MTSGPPRSIAAAYSRGGTAWARGPARVYGPLARLLVADSPVPLAGRLVLDVGAGTGVVSRAARAAGAAVVALDAALGMLTVERDGRPPAAVADATALPCPDRSVDGVLAAYVYHHLADPVAGLREAARVTRPGGPVLAASDAEDDAHPVREAVDAALAAAGFSAPDFYLEVKQGAVPRLATVDRVAAAARAAGLAVVGVVPRRVPFPDLAPDDLLAWRLGMAQYAWFLDGLAGERREAIEADARARLGPAPPPLVRSVIHLLAYAP